MSDPIFNKISESSAPKKSAVLEMRNITKTFGSITANKNVDLTVYRGEILAILGENGSGKTTLMNMISGIYIPTAAKFTLTAKKRS